MQSKSLKEVAVTLLIILLSHRTMDRSKVLGITVPPAIFPCRPRKDHCLQGNLLLSHREKFKQQVFKTFFYIPFILSILSYIFGICLVYPKPLPYYPFYNEIAMLTTFHLTNVAESQTHDLFDVSRLHFKLPR